VIDFDDKRWEGLTGGYQVPYDPRPALRRLETENSPDSVWVELWEELHHQGDVGDASYATVPFLVKYLAKSQQVDWNPYTLISCIEIERHRKSNPPLPVWLAESYQEAWREVLSLGARDLNATDDPLAVQSIVGTLALAKGEIKLGAFIVQSDNSEINELVEKHSAWSELYSLQDDG
jgi:hypothetical protein